MEQARKKCIGFRLLNYHGQEYPTHYIMVIWKDGHVTYTADTLIGTGKYDHIVTDSSSLDELISKQRLSLMIALESRKVKHRIAKN